ncbi:cation-translocating P-type ATPase [Algoriphagus sp. CAU 1675]|uniref:cation-translocating P-type ATPase n=1 Tax=Algoriphagus sp. CAU 1675 TaxID=3032597 RepID=UPI0023DA1021|nr:cation-translocating P-type ATPase [Algoriphagus sp. CAU 1675]MDF2157099.1 cation-translocating P-type ATPase [Algoriphagus sp. CAU 1675]
MNFFSISEKELYESLKSGPSGLSQQEAANRLLSKGPNKLIEKKKQPAWKLFLGQFKDFMISILIIAALLSGIAGEITDTIIILVIIILNAILGFVQEYRAEKAMESLKKLTQPHSKVIREGQLLTLLSEELVPGDLVLLEAGNMVPADIRLLEIFSLKVDESSLTGESVAVEKSTLLLTDENLNPGDQKNMAFKGTLITSGRGKGIVVSTGMDTMLGKIASMLQEKEGKTPLQERMNRFGKMISYIILLICLFLFGLGWLRGEEFLPLLLLTVSLAVAAIPEALPALITIALSLGAARLAKKNTLIRKLPAVESLGSVTFICTDKTGTITQNKMKVVKMEDESTAPLFSGINNLLLSMGLNEDVHLDENSVPQGEATELAMVEELIFQTSLEEFKKVNSTFKRIGEVPFDSERKRMSTIHLFGDRYLVVTKGASESVASLLQSREKADHFREKSQEWACQGIRVLAFAMKIVDHLPEENQWTELESELEAIGLVGLIDPPREEVNLAIEECKTAGIRPVMITGDHPATAKAIAQDVGIWNEGDLVLSGSELAQMNDQEFADKVEKTTVYARVSPDQKLRIVRALQAKGHYAAMTGDGVNDAPSLRAANMGIAMGISGTDVSKEAAHMILLDDNFSTIVNAVKEGRRIFDNIRKFVKYIMTCNSAEIWTIALAPVLGLPIPLLPIHILWINLVTDGLPALALAGERSEKNVMKRPPRKPQESLFSDGVGYHIIWVGILMAGLTLFTQYWSLETGKEHWQTMVFAVLSFSQLAHVMAVRSDHTFLYRQGFFSNMPLLIAVSMTMVFQLAVIYLPSFNYLFKTQALSLEELIFCFSMALILFHAVELEKFVRRKLKNKHQKNTD